MFTGIVEGMAGIRDLARAGEITSLFLDLGEFSQGVGPGDSILVDGVCLTVESLEGAVARFSAVQETLAVTTLGERKAGDRVNIERSLKVGDRLGGHFVFGHVDGVGEVLEATADPASIRVRVPRKLAIYLIPKGSISIDGVSLTIASVEGDTFTVALVPFTLEKTTLGLRQPGHKVNLESDYLARIVHQLIGDGR